MPAHELRADRLLVKNIEALLAARGIDAKALAIWCGHKSAWISKILSGDRGLPFKELGRVADFFGLTPSQLLQQGISPLTERRRVERRSGLERRAIDRRRPFDPERIHPDVSPIFRSRRDGENSKHPEGTP